MNVSLSTLWEGSEFQRSNRYGDSSATRIKNAGIIVREFLKAGLPLGIALAAVVNARDESDLSSTVGGDKGKSIGLFQLASFGAGAGMTVEERQDPKKNTQRIIEEVLNPRWGTNLINAYNNGESLATLSFIFGRDIERPASGGVGRDDSARKVFPLIADLPANMLSRKGAIMGTIAITGVVALLVVGGLYLYSRRSQ